MSEDETKNPIEEIARAGGWAPKDQWKGDDASWKDATTFVGNTIEISNTQRRTIDRLRAEVEAVTQAQQRQAEVHISTVAEAASKAKAGERERLEAEKLAAMEEDDHKAVVKADRDLRKLDNDPVVEPPIYDQQAIDAFVDFRVENESWYGKDDELSQFAMNKAKSIREQNPDLPAKKMFSLVTKETKDAFPEKFKTKKPALVEEPAGGGGGSAEKGYADLPEEAKKAAAMFVEDGTFKDKAEYAKMYFEEVEK